MEEEIKEPGKTCPICERKYSEGDNYCPNDGSRLVVADENTMSVMPEITRDTDPDLHEPSGHSEQG